MVKLNDTPGEQEYSEISVPNPSDFIGSQERSSQLLPAISENFIHSGRNIQIIRKKNKILIVDDEPFNQEALKLVLRESLEITSSEMEILVDTANDGNEAVEMV